MGGIIQKCCLRFFKRKKWLQKEEEALLSRRLLYNRLMLAARLIGNVVTTCCAIRTSAPYDTSLRRTRSRTCRLVMIAYTLDTFVGIDIVNLFSRRIILVVNDRFYRALIDTGTAVNTSISNQYSHFKLLFKI
jgi:hypothetical protein